MFNFLRYLVTFLCLGNAARTEIKTSQGNNQCANCGQDLVGKINGVLICKRRSDAPFNVVRWSSVAPSVIYGN